MTVTETVAPPTPEVKPKPQPSKFKSCDANIRARRGTTTCAFAQNVFLSYWQSEQSGGSETITAYSPATGQAYNLECQAGSRIVCRAGDGGEVRFPYSAIAAYDEEQADRFCSTHDTGGSCSRSWSPDAEAEPEETSASESSDCDPNYAGECLDPNSYDYDCAGGSGDGPDYTGMVQVVGDDVHDLDRDGDGIACDT